MISTFQKVYLKKSTVIYISIDSALPIAKLSAKSLIKLFVKTLKEK